MKTSYPLRSLVLSFLLFLALYATAFPETPPPTTGRLTVSVHGLKTTNGKVIVNVFRKEDDLFGKPYLQREAVITQTTATLEFPDLPFASYTVFAFHDENNNGTVDHNLFRMPKEPMGYSNHWHFGLFTGMPTFEKTKVEFSQGKPEVTITLK